MHNIFSTLIPHGALHATSLRRSLIVVLSLSLIIQFVLCPLPVRAQDKTPPTTKQQTAELREKAFKLLASLAGEVSGLQSPQNRVRLGSNIAGSIWEYDEKQARALFASVEEEIKTNLHYPEPYDPLAARNFMIFLKLRADTVGRIVKYDAELALAFLKATQPTAKGPMPDAVAESQRALETLLANQVVATDPAMAVELGRKQISKGLNLEAFWLLRELNRKDREQARIFHKAIVEKLRDDPNYPSNWAERQHVMTLVYSFMPPAAESSTFRQLFDALAKNAQRQGCEKRSADSFSGLDCGWFGSLVRIMDQIDSAYAGPYKRWDGASEGEDQSDALEQPAYYDMDDLSHEGDVEGLLKLLPKYPHLATAIQEQALTLALNRGDFEQAEKIAADFKGNPMLGKRWLKEIEERKKRNSVTDEQIAKIEAEVEQFNDPGDRRQLLYYANSLSATNRKASLRILDRLSDMISSMKPGRDQLEQQQLLAARYCAAGGERGLAIMESVVPQLNELIEAAAKLDGYEMNYLTEGEWNMSGEGTFGASLTRLADGAPLFAWCDFDRAVNAAARFDRNEIRMMTQIKLAQGILAGRPAGMVKEVER